MKDHRVETEAEAERERKEEMGVNYKTLIYF